jgi:HlyD family secretion protein
MHLAYLANGKRIALIVGGVVVVGGIIAWFLAGRHSSSPTVTTVAVQRGDLVATVTATGTIEPEEVIDVGAQVVGIIQEFGPDPADYHRPIDFGSVVEVGTILARIDDTLYRARLDKAAAMVEQAAAQVTQADADVQKAEATEKDIEARSKQAAQDLVRARGLVTKLAMTQEDYDARVAAYDVTRADVDVAKAAIGVSQATLGAARKTLLGAEADRREAQRNLDYTVIKSPVKGVVVDRRVNVGQTVVSSLNAPSLFLIAKDLRRLQVWASVNEADIGRIQSGQSVRFTVDAFPGQEFQGVVSQIRLNATMTQNVVTYTVVVTTDNSDGRLLPYLTATLKFETGRRSNVLLVPNAALRWQAPTAGAAHADRGTVWVQEGGSARQVEVQTGLTDGMVTEVVGGDLQAGQLVIVGAANQGGASGTANPFSPNLFGGNKK